VPKTKQSPSRWTKELFVRAVTVDERGCWFLPTNKTRAHIIAYRLYHGAIPKTQKKGGNAVALCVCHRCDVPACCNPEHLFLGTFKENNNDRAKKGRSYYPVGELNVMKRPALKEARSGEGNPMYGRRHSEETRKKIGEASRGELSRSKRPDVRAKLSDSGKAVPNVTCEHCGKELKPWTHARWHGENCNARKN
jgi:hypothetical protein